MAATTEERVRDVVNNVLVLESQDDNTTSLYDVLAADEMDLVELVHEIEEEFDIDIMDKDAKAWQSVQDIINTVEKAKG